MAVLLNPRASTVALLKIVLPLAALALLSTLFLWQGKIDPSRALPYADVDVDTLARSPRMTAPDFAGVTSDGSAISLQADVVIPDAQVPGRLQIDAPQMRIETPDGLSYDVSAQQAWVEPEQGVLRLGGDVEIISSGGFDLSCQFLEAAMYRTQIVARGDMLARGPGARITADEARIIPAGDESAPYLLVFKGQVKLVYGAEP